MRWNPEGHNDQNILAFSLYIVYPKLYLISLASRGAAQSISGQHHAELPALKSTNGKACQRQTVSN